MESFVNAWMERDQMYVRRKMWVGHFVVLVLFGLTMYTLFLGLGFLMLLPFAATIIALWVTPRPLTLTYASSMTLVPDDLLLAIASSPEVPHADKVALAAFASTGLGITYGELRRAIGGDDPDVSEVARNHGRGFAAVLAFKRPPADQQAKHQG